MLQYLVKVVQRTNEDVLKFREELGPAVAEAKGIQLERLSASANQLRKDLRIVAETSKKDGEEYRKFLRHPADPKYKCQNHAQAQQASMNELRQMVTFLTEKEVPMCQMDSTHFERFALFSKLELQETMSAIEEANQNYISVLEYFGEDTKTQASDFFATIDQFMEAFGQALDLIEKEELMKMKKVQRRLAKEASLKLKSATEPIFETPRSSASTRRVAKSDGKTSSSGNYCSMTPTLLNKTAARNGSRNAAITAAAALTKNVQSQSPLKAPSPPLEKETLSYAADGSPNVSTAKELNRGK